MELKEIVALYATKEDKTVNVDLKNLSMDDCFRSQVLAAILKQLEEKPNACVILPSFQKNQKNLGKLINELASSLLVKTLVTGDVVQLKHIRKSSKKDVILIKQSFRAGNELAEQIAAIKEMGSTPAVICLISHSRAKLENFAQKNGVEISALVYTDEI